MMSHVMVGTDDLSGPRAFHDGALGAPGIPASDPARPMCPSATGVGPAFVVVSPRDRAPANGGTVGFVIGFIAPDAAAIDAFHAAGLAAGGSDEGGSDEGAPGVRQTPGGPRYGAYRRDPDGNKIRAFATVVAA